MNAIRAVFAANVLVAGAVGLASLFGGAGALRTVWQAAIDPTSQPVRVVGAFWIVVLPVVIPWRELIASW